MLAFDYLGALVLHGWVVAYHGVHKKFVFVPPGAMTTPAIPDMADTYMCRTLTHETELPSAVAGWIKTKNIQPTKEK